MYTVHFAIRTDNINIGKAARQITNSKKHKFEKTCNAIGLTEDLMPYSWVLEKDIEVQAAYAIKHRDDCLCLSLRLDNKDLMFLLYKKFSLIGETSFYYITKSNLMYGYNLQLDEEDSLYRDVEIIFNDPKTGKRVITNPFKSPKSFKNALDEAIQHCGLKEKIIEYFDMPMGRYDRLVNNKHIELSNVIKTINVMNSIKPECKFTIVVPELINDFRIERSDIEPGLINKMISINHSNFADFINSINDIEKIDTEDPVERFLYELRL